MKMRRGIHPVCTQDDWAVSKTTGHSIDGAILHVRRFRMHGKNLPFDKHLRGNGDGCLFPSLESADQWAFDHGYLQLYFTHPETRARRKANAFNPKSALIAA